MIMHENIRDYRIDNLKAIGILLVVFGHNNYSVIGDYIYTFHMPIFFFISGLVYNISKKSSFKTYVGKKVNSLLLPYFLFAIVLYIFWFLIGRKFGDSASLNLSPIKNLIGIIYAQGGESYMDWGRPLWFLPCLFIVTLLFYPLAKLNKWLIGLLIIVSALIGFILNEYLAYRLPWSLDVAFTALLFYGSGYLFKVIWLKNNWYYLLAALLFFIISIALFRINGRIDMSDGDYNNYLLFILSAFSGILFMLFLVYMLPQIKIINFIGINSLVIMALHLRALTFIKAIEIYVFGIPYESNLSMSLFHTLMQVIILIPIIYFINKYIPVFAGKHSSKIL